MDSCITYPELAMTLAAHPTGIREMVLQRPLVPYPRRDSFPGDSGITIGPLVIGLSMMLLMRRHRC